MSPGPFPTHSPPIPRACGPRTAVLYGNTWGDKSTVKEMTAPRASTLRVRAQNGIVWPLGFRLLSRRARAPTGGALDLLCKHYRVPTTAQVVNTSPTLAQLSVVRVDPHESRVRLYLTIMIYYLLTLLR